MDLSKVNQRKPAQPAGLNAPSERPFAGLMDQDLLALCVLCAVVAGRQGTSSVGSVAMTLTIISYLVLYFRLLR